MTEADAELRTKLTSVFRSLCNSGDIKTKHTTPYQVALISGKYFINPKLIAESSFIEVGCKMELFQVPLFFALGFVLNECFC